MAGVLALVAFCSVLRAVTPTVPTVVAAAAFVAAILGPARPLSARSGLLLVLSVVALLDVVAAANPPNTPVDWEGDVPEGAAYERIDGKFQRMDVDPG